MPVLDIAMLHGDVQLMQEAVGSVLAQTDDRQRLKVIDDGAEPGIPERFAGLPHPQVTSERNPHQLEILRNFHKCVDEIRADHSAIFGDDRVLPTTFGRRK